MTDQGRAPAATSSIFNNAGSVDVIVDVVGYFEPGTGSPFRPLTNPVRIQDSRPSVKVGAVQHAVGPGRPTATSRSPGRRPTSRRRDVAALLNVTVTGTTASSFLTVCPNGAPADRLQPELGPGQTVANSVTASSATRRRGIRAFNQAGSTDVLMDVSGYYGP